MKSWLTQRPVFTYYLLTLAISWSYWITLILQGKHVTPGSNVSHFPGLLGPLIAAVIATAYLEGKAGLADLMRRMFRIRTAWPRSILIALAPVPAAVIIFVVMHWFGKPLPPLQDFQTFPGVPAGLPLWTVISLVFIVNGYGEETGWRGFVMEKWLPDHGRFQTTIRLAGLWLFWHAPMFWLNDTMAALVGPMLIGWAIGLICGAFVLAQLYLMSGRSIFVLALWHAAYNMVVAPPAWQGIPAAAVSTAIMIWGLIVAWKWWREDRISKRFQP
jgi:membrane protease YdiL (CAAX protease family)